MANANKLQVDVAVPEYMLLTDSNKTPYRAYSPGVPLSDVRLVAAMPHPETGVLRDVIINELAFKRESLAQVKGDEPPARYIAGLVPQTFVPYPEKADDMEYDDNDIDTLRIEVEAQTWTPTLRRPPMYPGIIDELRNKYGKFRTRHDEDYIARKIAEDEAAKARLAGMNRKVITPLKDLHKKERAEKKALGRPELSDADLATIGEVMAKNVQSRSTLEL